MPGTPDAGPRVVLLAGPGDTTDIVANYLRRRVPDLEVVVEDPPSRIRLARRRAARIGWPTVVGQILFVTLALPVLRRMGRNRIGRIVRDAGLDATPFGGTTHVTSVNDPATVDLLRGAQPSVVVVNGTRIIAPRVLDAVDCPFVNTHAGITPRYRGAHGGYWALAEGHPELVGTTVHLVDQGIDTGGVLARATFDTAPDDSIATYPYLHLAAGLPLLAAQVGRALAGEPLTPVVEDVPPGGTRLYLHPTLWEYLRRRLVDGVR
ncbi:MAG: formyl transferase [Acidimicrobiales bacterium]